jgi:integrase
MCDVQRAQYKRSMSDYKVYEDKKKGCFLVRWQEGTAWKTKRVPAKVRERFDAERWTREWWAGRDVTGFAPQVVDTVSSVCERWVEHLKSKGDERTWKDADALKRNWIAPFKLAKVRADRLTLADCVRWVEDVERKAKADFTFRNVVQRARTMLADARGHGWYSGENFFADDYLRRMVKGCEPTAGADVIIHLPAGEALKVLGYKGEAVPPRRHAKNVLAMLTGMRAGELCGLTWRHLDLDGDLPSVRVERQLTRDRGFKDPKKKSFRTIPLHPLAVQALRSWREVGFSGLTGSQPTQDSPVFPDAAGAFVYDSNAAHDWRIDLCGYGCSPHYEGKHPIDFHALRRTFMTLLNEAKVPEHVIKQLAGHAKQGVTRRSYIDRDSLAVLSEAIMRMPFEAPPPPPKPATKGAKVVSLADRRKRTA